MYHTPLLNTMTDDMFEDSYTPWLPQEEAWLWEQYRDGVPIGELCRALNRFPDDVCLFICSHSTIKLEDITGFGTPDHLALWHQQQLATQRTPLYALRKELQRQEFHDKMYDMLRAIYTRPEK